MSISTIQTTYKGYRFRSRLEARWAVFFDALEIKWEYEPQGYQKEVGDNKKIMYLPDFYLPDSKLYIEVKGNSDFKEWANLAQDFLDWDCPMPFFTDSYDAKISGFVIVGNIPNPDTYNYFGIIRHHEGLMKNFMRFHKWQKGDVCFLGDDVSDHRILIDTESDDIPEYAWGWEHPYEAFDDNKLEALFSNKCLELKRRDDNSRYVPATKAAYLKARGARFEYGENR